MQGGQRLARLHRIAQLLVQRQPHRGVDLVLQPRATGAQQHGRPADALRIHALHVAAAGREEVAALAGSGQAPGGIHHAGVPTLLSDNLPKLLRRLATTNHLIEAFPPYLQFRRGATQHQHPGAQLPAELPKVFRPLPFERGHRFGHFQGIPHREP